MPFPFSTNVGTRLDFATLETNAGADPRLAISLRREIGIKILGFLRRSSTV